MLIDETINIFRIIYWNTIKHLSGHLTGDVHNSDGAVCGAVLNLFQNDTPNISGTNNYGVFGIGFPMQLSSLNNCKAISKTDQGNKEELKH